VDHTASRGWRHPVPQRDDFTRIAANLRARWTRQLRTVDGPTLLVVLTQDLLDGLDARAAEEAHDLTMQLQEILCARRAPSALLFHEEPFLPAAAMRTWIDDGWRYVHGTTEGRYRSVLLVENPAARVGLTSRELDPLVGPWMRW
jgi:hypothetical protein